MPSWFEPDEAKPVDFWQVVAKAARKQGGLSDKWMLISMDGESVVNGTLCTLYEKIGVITKGARKGCAKLGNEKAVVVLSRADFEACRAEHDALEAQHKAVKEIA